MPASASIAAHSFNGLPRKADPLKPYASAREYPARATWRMLPGMSAGSVLLML